MTYSTINPEKSNGGHMTTLFIDNGISINLDDYMRDPISGFKRVPPRFVASSVGERLAIAEFTKHHKNVILIRDFMSRSLFCDCVLMKTALDKYNDTMAGLCRANPNGWAV